MSNWAALSRLVNVSSQQVFGTSVSYQPAGGAAFTVVGIPERTSDEEKQSAGVYLRLFVHLADFAEPPAQGDEVTIDGIAYTVFDVQEDSGGGARLSVRVST